ncbi:tyrosine-type recombinase/integrase, partial [Rhizocola hellebori]|uniref:tyrosine-type recombinase/integrase n=1 Tax=Rhizocola hellebori TaxID=1392758 RepID=UPI003571631A
QDRTRGPELARAALDALATKLDGTRAAPTTIARKRAALYNAFDFAVETGQLPSNPIDNVRWKMPKKAEALDPQAVISLKQGQRLLAQVHSQGLMGARLMPFFACLMYAGLRPAEAIALRLSDIVSLPETGWGEFRLRRSAPRSGLTWSDTGRSREDRSLKHRSIADTRLVPIHPALCGILREHITACAVPPGARLFAG